MNMQYFWLVFGLFGIIGAIIPAAQMGTDIYFDINFMDYQKSISLSNYMGRSSYTFVTPDSVNMIFESLSSSGETYLFDMHTNKKNKITKLIDSVKSNKFAGFLEESNLDNSEIKKLSIYKPNPFHEPFREVEKVVYEIEKRFIK